MAAKFGASDGWDPKVPRGACGQSARRGIMNQLSTFKSGLAYEVGDGRRIKF